MNYLNRKINSGLVLGFRSDLLDDKKGQGQDWLPITPGNTLYAKKYIGNTVLLRPELRFDHSWDLRGYNNGKIRNQLFFGMDIIYTF